MQDLTRRGLIGSLGAIIAAPAIVRVQNIMPVRVIPTWRLTLVENLETLVPVAMKTVEGFLTDTSFVASGKTMGPLRYVVLSDDITGERKIWDYGWPVTLQDGERFTLDFAGRKYRPRDFIDLSLSGSQFDQKSVHRPLRSD